MTRIRIQPTVIGMIMLLFLSTIFIEESPAQALGVDPELTEFIAENPIDAHYRKAQEELFSNEYWTTRERERIEYEHLQHWDVYLNEVYSQLMSELSTEKKSLLRESQRAWLAHYRAEREFFERTFDIGWIGTEGIISWLRHLKEWKASRTLELLEYHYLLSGELVEYEPESW